MGGFINNGHTEIVIEELHYEIAVRWGQNPATRKWYAAMNASFGRVSITEGLLASQHPGCETREEAVQAAWSRGRSFIQRHRHEPLVDPEMARRLLNETTLRAQRQLELFEETEIAR